MYKKPAIICDLDGTLCNVSHRVHHVVQKPKNWDAFYGAMCHDEIIPAVELLLRTFEETTTQVIFLTGRPDNYRNDTIGWLENHDFFDTVLFMRVAGDKRTDDIVKREIYERDIAPYYNVQFVLEDRSRVVRMWRELKIPCFQVADGDF